MKLQPDRIDSANVIGAHGPEGVTVNGRLYTRSIIVPHAGEVVEWDGREAQELQAEHFEQVAALSPEVVLFGSGPRLRFPRPEALRPLVERGVGMETMDTAAACRTYNVLISEGRSVVAALLVKPLG
ncbi:Mth938-like domain-containing protein [Aquabacterium sp. A7-Y]|uniref:Mth938-like domain-containing protein n=1 Tax=Aquabacterium sp. A7-Y TaxID=1349605 RepID=UPI00223CCBC7|nr:Mth938-like domain-containing protein [Aquabacterium sp. A7-Y]MCW7541317.1 Mth938-like domain-containing protein [Aquabacterium sp. A7-Y]